MLAQHSYLAQGPGDLEFNKGDVLDILSEGSSPVLPAGCTGTGFWSKLWGGTGLLQSCLRLILLGGTGLHWGLPRVKFQP